MYGNSVPVFPLPGRPPSTDGFIEAVKFGHFDWAFLLPVIIDELSKDPEALELVVSKLQFLFYTGGALPPGAGNMVSPKIPLFSALGSSECSAFPLAHISESSFTESWRYFNFHPGAGAEFRHHMDDLHELIIVRTIDHPEFQPVFSIFPDLDEYETHDLLSPHPEIPGLWRHRGRRDDIIVFVNGEKTNPVSFEEQVSKHPNVQIALVSGNQRFEACLLVEPATTGTLSDLDKRDLIEKIWPTVEEANAQCPAHARVSKSKILVLDPEKPMPRASKGTVQRSRTLQLYAEEIDALYSETDTQSTLLEQPPNSVTNPDNAAKYLHELVAEITSWPEFQDDTDFFTLGLDSLQTLRLGASIRSNFGVSSITPSVIYKNASVELLLKKIYPENAPASKEHDRTTAMTQVLQQYEQLIDDLASKKHNNSLEKDIHAPQVVLLTGSTGSVGSFVLKELLARSEVSHIYCLNRGQDSGSLQATRNRQRGITSELPSNRVTFLTVDLTKESFGLDPKTYGTLAEQTTQIIHNAWPVNFNQPLQFFKPSLDGLLRLVSFAYQGQLSPSLLFLSSISAVGSYNQISGANPLVPEETISDLACTAPMGYGESKYLGERILGYASEKLSTRCGVSRVGQVSGTRENPRGWNRAEWLPSLIASSRYLKALPDSLAGSSMDYIDWVPVDDLASIIVELSSSLAGISVTGTAQIFNCVNPHDIAWAELIPVIVQELEKPLTSDGEKSEVVTVGFREWLDRLTASEAALVENKSLDASVRQNPAVKLIDFYEQLIIEGQDSSPVRLSTEKSAHTSEHLRNLKPINPEWMRGWIQGWINYQ
jgi:thioester reductase-like protein/aryl carrier-like protein